MLREREGETSGVSQRGVQPIEHLMVLFLMSCEKNVLFFNAALPNTKPYQ